MAKKFGELIQAIKDEGPDLEKACLVLGLLIERQRTNIPRNGENRGVREVLGEEYADIWLTDHDIANAINHLIAYVSSTNLPIPSSVWALSKSYESRVVPTLISTLRQSSVHPDQYLLAHNALHGVITCGLSSELSQAAIQAIRDTAANGVGDIQEEALEYLEHYHKVTGSEHV